MITLKKKVIQDMIEATRHSVSSWSEAHGFAQSTLSAWLNGNRNISRKQLEKLASALHVPVSYISDVPIIDQNFLSFYRQRKGVTRSELGRVIGVSEDTITSWEDGSQFFDLKYEKALRNALDLDENETLNFIQENAFSRKMDGIADMQQIRAARRGTTLAVEEQNNIQKFKNGLISVLIDSDLESEAQKKVLKIVKDYNIQAE